MTAAESLLAYRRRRLGEAEAAARDTYASLLLDDRDLVAEIEHDIADRDRAYWRRLYALGMQRVARLRNPGSKP